MSSKIYILFFTGYLQVLMACEGLDTSKIPPPKVDVVWCDIKAIKCLAYFTNDQSIPTSCQAISLDPLPASAPGAGDYTCFDSTMTSPEAACGDLCNPFSGHLNLLAWPDSFAGFTQLRKLCSSGINRDPAFHTSLNSQGFQPKGCPDLNHTSSASFPLSSVGSVATKLTGVGTVSLGDSHQTVGLKRGYFDMDAPNTSCTGSQSNCPTQINQTEVAFDDFVIHDVPIHNLTIDLRTQFLTSSGVFIPNSNRFIFTIPQGVIFNAVATVKGKPAGLTVTSNREVFGSLDPITGNLAFQFSVSGTLDGIQFSASGVATGAQVIEMAPTVTAPSPVSIDAVAECSATTTLTATASSPVNLPVTLTFVSEAGVLGTGDSISATLPIGVHTISIVGIDSVGGSGNAKQLVTVVDRTPPVFESVPGSVDLHSCSNVAGPVNVPIPSAKGMCSGDPATVTGEIIEFNGTTASIPIVSGHAILPQGSGTIRWTAHGSNGVEATITQVFTVYPPAALYSLAGLTNDKRSVVDGAIFNAAGGPVFVDDEGQVKDVFSLSAVTFGNRVTAVSVVTPAGFVPGDRDTIGTISTNTPNLLPIPVISPVFAGGTDVRVVRGTASHVVPGQYGTGTVDRDGTLNLDAGDYYFTSLVIESDAHLILPEASTEVVRIFVRDRLDLHQSPRTPSGNLASTYLAYTGERSLNIDEVFSGTIMAPNALLRLLDPTLGVHDFETYRGEFFAKQIFIDKRVVIESAPFTCR